MTSPVDWRPPPPRTGGMFGHALTGLTTVMVVGVWGTALFGAWIHAIPTWLVLILTVLPLVGTLLLGWTFILWTIFPDHRAAPWLLGACCVAPLIQWGPGWADRGVAPSTEDLTVMTWNVRRLWGGPDDGGSPVACVTEAVDIVAPDILVLEEVTTADLRKLKAGLPLDCVHTTYRDVDDSDSAGVAVCARGDAWELVSGAPVQFEERHDWQYIVADFERAGRRIHVMGVHLHPYRILHDPSRLLEKVAERAPEVTQAQASQTDALLEEIGRLTEPTIVAGDFNSTRDTPFHARLRRQLVDVWEQGAIGFVGTVELLDLFPLRIDYVYADPRLEVADATVPAVGCSDHRPVVGRLRPP